jgi:hypothetical protein
MAEQSNGLNNSADPKDDERWQVDSEHIFALPTVFDRYVPTREISDVLEAPESSDD